MSEHPEHVEHDEDNLEDFDAFWSARDRKTKTTRIMGELVELPPALPLRFELEARKLEKSKRDKDVRRLVGILFGADKLDAWTERGMDMDQFAVLLAWAPQVIAGRDVTLAEVADSVERHNAKQLNKGKGNGAADPR